MVDDHPIVREGLAQLINRQQDLMVSGDAEEMHSALRAIELSRPDILMVDTSLNGPDGLDLSETDPRQGPAASDLGFIDAR